MTRELNIDERSQFVHGALARGISGLSAARLAARLAVAISLGVLLSIDSVAWTVQAPYVITQKDIAFNPRTVTLNCGDTVQFFNDEISILHHAYVEADKFNFDTGDQMPGTRTNVVFSVPGTFDVLCGIHPMMKLVVRVK